MSSIDQFDQPVSLIPDASDVLLVPTLGFDFFAMKRNGFKPFQEDDAFI
jgi:hypothetical protein